jgi:hypothetical protein
MTCCVVGLLIFAGVRWARRLLGSAPTEMHAHFAPMASRPAPGEVPEASRRPVRAESPAVAREAPAGLFAYFAAGIAVYLIALMVLLWTGAAQSVGGPLAWVVRTGCYLGLLLAAVRLSRPRQRLDARRGAAWALIAVGAAIFELGVLDMHLFGVIEVAHGNPLWDIAFHNFGPALALTGAFLLLRAGAGRSVTSSRSSRSTSTRARPSASAFAVPVTPPRTR